LTTCRHEREPHRKLDPMDMAREIVLFPDARDICWVGI
jgi:hypothetical protein